jgi:hypothetical protein
MDKVCMMEYLYHHCNDWGAASVNFTWGINGAVRGASNRKLTLCDLNLSHGYGPERDGPLSRALLLVLCKGGIHKDQHKTDKQVCTWHHINYLLWHVFSTASYVIWSLTQKPDVSFFHVFFSCRQKKMCCLVGYSLKVSPSPVSFFRLFSSFFTKTECDTTRLSGAETAPFKHFFCLDSI